MRFLVLGIALFLSACELSVGDRRMVAKFESDNDAIDAPPFSLSAEQRIGFEKFTGVPYPDEFNQLVSFCRAKIPPLVGETRKFDGYLEDRAIRDVRNAGGDFVEKWRTFKFVEYRLRQPYEVGATGFNFVRLSLADDGDPRCADFQAAIQGSKSPVGAPLGKCLAAEFLADPSAMVIYRNVGNRRGQSANFGYTITGEEIVDTSDNSRLGGTFGLILEYADGERLLATMNCRTVGQSLEHKVVETE